MRKHLIILSAFLPVLPIAFFTFSGLVNAQFSDIKYSDFKVYIEESAKKGIISGYPDQTFRPKNNVTFVEALKIVINSGPKRKLVAPTIEGQHWSVPFKAVYEREDKTNSVIFRDNQNVTREFVIYLLLRQNGISFEKEDFHKFSDVNFSDVNENTPFGAYILFAKKVGIIQGNKNGTFGVGSLVNRGELTKMTYNTLIKNPEAIVAEYEKMLSFNSASEAPQIPVPQPNVTSVTSPQPAGPAISQQNIAPKVTPAQNTTTQNTQNKLVPTIQNQEKSTTTTTTKKIAYTTGEFTSLDNIKSQVKSVIEIKPDKIYLATADKEKIHAVTRSNGELGFIRVSNPQNFYLYIYKNGIPFLSKTSETLSQNQIRDAMIREVNILRTQNNLPKFKENLKLNKTAQDYAKTMHTYDFFSHTGKDGSAVWDRAEDNGYMYEFITENIAKGQKTVSEVMQDFFNSPSHRENILNEHVDEVGIGFYGNYWVQVFGKEYHGDE